MPPLEVNTIILGASSFVGALSGVATITWWLSKQFREVYKHVANVKDELLREIANHEKLDAARFEGQSLAIMKLELTLQTIGAVRIEPPTPKKHS